MNREVNNQLDFHLMRPPIIRFFNNKGKELESYPSVSTKKALIIRYGAIGDMVFISPLPRLLKEQGYYVVVNTQPTGVEVLQQNPYIDEFWLQDRDVIANKNLGPYWKLLGEGFDRVIQLSESIERTMLKIPGREDFNEPRDKEALEKNYFDVTMEKAGFSEKTGMRGELYFSDEEEAQVREFMEEYKDRFVVLCVLAGSSFSKAWWGWEFMFNETSLYKDIPELLTITTGDEYSRLLEWKHPQNFCGSGSGKLSIRMSFLIAKYCNLVIGPDTGIVNAAGCFSTPKICLLGQTTPTNITKYWENDFSIVSPAACSPCYNLVYSREQCERGKVTGNCICMEAIKPDVVARKIKEVYKQWKRDRYYRIVTPAEYRRGDKGCQPLVMS